MHHGLLGPEDRDTLSSIGNLGSTLNNSGKIEEAEKVLRRALDGQLRVLGQDDLDTAITESNLSELLNGRGCHDEARELAQKALPVQEKRLGTTARNTMLTARNLAAALSGLGYFEGAEPLARRSFDVLKAGPPDDREFALCVKVLAGIMNGLGKHEEAAELLEQQA